MGRIAHDASRSLISSPRAWGSPVLDDRWQVVALHHAARPLLFPGATQTTLDMAKAKAPKYHNEGVAIHAILDHLAAADATRDLGRLLLARARSAETR